MSERIRVVDTHTGGEPTRVVVESPIELVAKAICDQRTELREKHDAYRRAIVCEPRGSDVMVGALLTPPQNPGSVAGVVFFNNVGYLGMCGHGTIGVAIALQHLGRIDVGRHAIDTPVGTVEFTLEESGEVSLANVPSFRYRQQVALQLDADTCVHGDIAWGGNWLFICEDHGLQVHPDHIPELNAFARRIRRYLDQHGITGEGGAIIDHVDLIGPASSPEIADAKNFVLCPGGAYDRSPCGTGTSAKLACMAADGKLLPGEVFRQESIVGSVFRCTYETLDNGHILPTICGTAFVSAEADLILDPRDPFCMGLE